MIIDDLTISGALIALAVAIVVFYVLRRNRSGNDQD